MQHKQKASSETNFSFVESTAEMTAKRKLHSPADGTPEKSNPLHSVTVRRPPLPDSALAQLSHMNAELDRHEPVIAGSPASV